MYKTTVGVEGMKCPKCEERVCRAFEKAFSARKLSASHKDCRAVFVSGGEVSLEQAAAALEGTGFKAVSCTSVPEEKKKLFGFGR